MSVSGIEELEHKLKTMSDPNLKQAVSTGIQIVRSAAVMNCHVDMGELRQSIYAEVSEQDGKVIGTCWTDKEYAPYVEFGTGPKGQENHAGISQKLLLHIHRHPGGSMRARWMKESRRNITGFTLILLKEDFINALDNRHIRLCIRH